MKIADLELGELESLLAGEGVLLKIPPFVARIQSPITEVALGLKLMYADFSIERPGGDRFADYTVQLAPGRGIRKWLRPQVDFHFDGHPAFKPLSRHQAYPMLEWGLNWCIAAHSHHYLVFHAAVIELNGKAAILPAPPGSGKSTLCAGLVNRGWRLLSDELALLDPRTGHIHGMARPINLKNASIDIIKDFAPGCVVTDPVHDTAKGTVALLRPPTESVERVLEPAKPIWVIFPQYQADAAAELSPLSKARTTLRLAEQSFNYDIHGRRGFELISELLEKCDCFEFTYSSLDDAVIAFAALAHGNN